ncbi:hypothetical protein [Oceanicola sp. 22II-s10i]|uniref:hypothetical protein n=1 Tax=Oceanicola sp. 22II-s10i TaxID=1317116 RepID=UPI001131BCDE|nr:hypothetical protein [Oceanicola sp. 22II-s10i]
MLNRTGAALATIWLLAGTATAGEWFQHQYGELRAYHGDWLAVCADAGAGPCRVVASAKDPGSAAFFDRRIAVHRIDNSPDWAVEVMDRDLPAGDVTALRFVFDGVAEEVPAGLWTPGALDAANAADTLSLRDPDLAGRLVERMKAGNRLVVEYSPAGAGDGTAEFSLRGVTAAMNAVQARVLARQE